MVLGPECDTAALQLAHGKTVLVPFAEDNLVFDQVAVAAPRAMEAYAAAYATFRDEVERNPPRSLYPEREMWRHFRSAKLRPLNHAAVPRRFSEIRWPRRGPSLNYDGTTARSGAVAMPERVVASATVTLDPDFGVVHRSETRGRVSGACTARARGAHFGRVRRHRELGRAACRERGACTAWRCPRRVVKGEGGSSYSCARRMCAAS